MPKLTINDKEYELPAGLTILQACERIGIEIPNLCYHRALSAPVNCRLCLVEVEKFPRPQPSCHTQVQEGMVVRTDTEKIKEMRKGIIEFLLVNHPLDCPICDKAGECPLQITTMQYGPDRARLERETDSRPKRVALGPHIVYDAERCIICTRCIRFCNEITKTRELGLFERGNHTIMNTSPGGNISNEYSICVTDICPTGALTNKEFRFKERVWFLEETPSVCPECSRGCSVVLWTNGAGDAVRITPRQNENVNGAWMCDEGRLSYLDFEKKERILKARIKKEEASFENAISHTAEIIRNISKKHGEGAVAALASTFASNEELFLLKKLTAHIGILPPKEGKEDNLLKRKDKSPNSKGAALIVGTKDSIEKGIEAGQIKVLIALKPSMAKDFPVSLKTLSKLRAFILIDSYASPLEESATEILPCAIYAEEEGTFTNEFGWVQHFETGKRIKGDAKPAWSVLAGLIGAVKEKAVEFDTPKKIFEALAREISAFRNLNYGKIGKTGEKIKE